MLLLFGVIAVILSSYKWLVCYLLTESDCRIRRQLAYGNDSFTAHNDSQVYFCRSLSLAYIEVGVLDLCDLLIYALLLVYAIV